MKRFRTFWMIAAVIGFGQVAVGEQPRTPEEEQAARDRVRMAVQAICPVSGQKLGEHGEPLKVKIGKQELFLCCRPCAKGKVDAKHWATIHANFLKAQRICPVMEHELPDRPKWTTVEGRIIYVCCPPCIEKIEADPKTHVRKLDALYAASLEARRDQK